MKKLLSFIEWGSYLKEYESMEDFKKSLYDLGLDGIEIVRCGEDLIEKDLVEGIHLPFFTSWVDYYKKDHKRVIEEFGSLEVAEGFYTKNPEDLSDYYLQDLEYSKENCRYSVFHVANTTSLEYLNQNHHFTDEEIIDASAELINEIIKKSKIENLFLLENLYFPGLKFTDVNLTKRLIDKIDYKNIGFMLDIGHLMNTNPEIKTEDEGWDYVEKIIDDHKDLIDYFKGIHLHVSVTGDEIKRVKENPPDLSDDFYERFRQIYEAVKNIDAHSISKSSKAKKVIEKINPDYLVLEFKSETRAEREEKIKAQIKSLNFNKRV